MAAFENPMQTNGFGFLEFSSLEPSKLIEDFENLGFTKVATHRTQAIVLYRQGHIDFFLNLEKDSSAYQHAVTHGAGACAMGFQVKDAAFAYQRACELKATPAEKHAGLMINGIEGIGGAAIYFIDEAAQTEIYDNQFDFIVEDKYPQGAGLLNLDHVTHNVNRGAMDHWANFYIDLFNFREVRYFDIKGLKTGLISRAMASPCGKIKIPLNESTDDHSQIEEFLKAFNGEGIQHIALTSDAIAQSVQDIKAQGIEFLTVPEAYYEMIADRIPWHQENIAELKKYQILIDGEIDPKVGLLLQIFTQNMLGPVFFEIIQRKGNEGFGEGNFKALFESIERDQMRRGVL